MRNKKKKLIRKTDGIKGGKIELRAERRTRGVQQG